MVLSFTYLVRAGLGKKPEVSVKFHILRHHRTTTQSTVMCVNRCQHGNFADA